MQQCFHNTYSIGILLAFAQCYKKNLLPIRIVKIKTKFKRKKKQFCIKKVSTSKCEKKTYFLAECSKKCYYFFACRFISFIRSTIATEFLIKYLKKKLRPLKFVQFNYKMLSGGNNSENSNKFDF